RSDLVQEQIARDLKQEIAEKEDSHEQPELLARDGHLLVHRQCGKSDVDPVEIGDDVQEKKIRKNPDLYFPNRSGLDGRRKGGCFVAHDHLGVSLLGQRISSAVVAGPKTPKGWGD